MKDMTKGKELGVIIRFALPMLIANFFQQIQIVIDRMVVGHIGGDISPEMGKQALAAIQPAMPILFSINSFSIGLGLGATVLISQYMGAKRYQKVSESIDTSFVALFLMSIILTTVGLLILPALLTWINIPHNIQPLSQGYLEVMLSCFLISITYNGLTSVLRGLGDTRTPMYMGIAFTLLNILFDYLFVLVLDMGLRGAAYATVLAQFLVLAPSAWMIHKRHPLIHFSPMLMKFRRHLLQKIIKVGVPAGTQQSLTAIGMIVVSSMVNVYGEDAMAGFGAAGALDMLAVFPAMIFASALTTFTGQNIGAELFDRVKQGLKATLMVSIGYSWLISILVFIWGKELLSAFNSTPEVLSIGYNYLLITCSFYWALGIIFTLIGLFRGSGDSIIPLIISVITLWGIRIPLAYILPKYTSLGIEGIWWATPIAWIIGISIAIPYYYRGSWKNKSLISKKAIPLRDEEII